VSKVFSTSFLLFAPTTMSSSNCKIWQPSRFYTVGTSPAIVILISKEFRGGLLCRIPFVSTMLFDVLMLPFTIILLCARVILIVAYSGPFAINVPSRFSASFVHLKSQMLSYSR
jgi:hypothetical protein